MTMFLGRDLSYGKLMLFTLVEDLLSIGFNVLANDVDVVWMQVLIAYLLLHHKILTSNWIV